MSRVAFDASGEWLASAHATDLALWPLDEDWPRVLAGQGIVDSVAFTPDGKWLVSAGGGTVRAWPVSADGDRESRILLETDLDFPQVAIDPASRHVAVSSGSLVHVIPLDGERSRTLQGFSSKASLHAVAFGDGGRLVAAAPLLGPRDEKIVRVWNLETGAVQVLGPVPGAGDGYVGGSHSISFVGRDRLLASSTGTGLVLFDLCGGAARVLAPRPDDVFAFSHDGQFAVGPESLPPAPSAGLVRIGLDGSSTTTLLSHESATSIALDRTDTLVATGSMDGTIRISPLSAYEPHLLFGHEGQVRSVAFSPDGRVVASAGDDRTIRIWPVPNMSKSPWHKRPYEEILAALRSRTNLRVVPAPSDPTGWKLETGPFLGWAKRPPES